MDFLSKIEIFAEGLDHPECAVYHPDGSVWAGGEAGQIYKISPDGNKVTEVASTGGFILGLAISPDGTWILVCDSGQKCLWKFDLQSYELTEFGTKIENHSLKIPNYAAFDTLGNVYVSDSGTFRKIDGTIIKFDASQIGRVWVDKPINFANGIALDQQERYLYVVCSFESSVRRFPILKNGQAGDAELFVTIPKTIPDGIAFDSRGNLYVSCYSPNQIYKVSPNRKLSLLIDDWEAHTLSNPTNIAFMGQNFDKLLVANIGRWHISLVDLGTKGQKLVCHV